MAKPKVAKKNKFTDSNRKSSQRSSSNGSKTPSVLSTRSSKTSKNSKSSKSSRNSEISSKNDRKSEKKDVETFKTIYKASDEMPHEQEDKGVSNLTTNTMLWLEITICTYLMLAVVYQWIWGRDPAMWFVLSEILLIELIASLHLMLVIRRPFIGRVCFLLSVQFVLLFLLFSMFLHSPYSTKRPFFERVFGLSATCLISSAAHFFMVLQSIRFAGESEKRKDYSEKVIVEGVEKRRKDLYMMISDLISEICYDDKDMKVNLMIRDETGHPKSMRGAGVEAGVNRSLEMSTDGQRVNLSTSNTTLTRINVPKHKNHHHHHQKSKGGIQKELAPIIDSKYNNCSKQEKMLSPRKILT